MKVGLPLFMVVCLVSYGYCMGPDMAEETKTKIVCEECELSEFALTEHELNQIKMTKLSKCLVEKKKQIQMEEAAKEKKRVARSVDEQPMDTTSFSEMFKTSAHFKRILKQLMGLKQTVTSKVNDMRKNINSALTELEAEVEDEQDKDEGKPMRPQQMKLVKTQPKACDNKLVCEKPGHVLKIKQAVLTNDNNEQMCAKVSHVMPIAMENMNERCFEKNETTRIMRELCDGMPECEFSFTLDLQSLCECSDKKHLEIEYVCEPENSPSAVQSRHKRSMYYQNSDREIQSDKRYRKQFLDYYNDYYDYYGGYGLGLYDYGYPLYDYGYGLYDYGYPLYDYGYPLYDYGYPLYDYLGGYGGFGYGGFGYGGFGVGGRGGRGGRNGNRGRNGNGRNNRNGGERSRNMNNNRQGRDDNAFTQKLANSNTKIHKVNDQ